MQPNTKMSSGQATFNLNAARVVCYNLETDRADPTKWICLAATMLPAALDEIERLEAAYLKAQNSNLLRKQAYESLEKIANKQRAALKKLGQVRRERGKALVEERARRICHVPGDPVGHWARYEKVVVDDAREQLRREGLL